MSPPSGEKFKVDHTLYVNDEYASKAEKQEEDTEVEEKQAVNA